MVQRLNVNSLCPSRLSFLCCDKMPWNNLKEDLFLLCLTFSRVEILDMSCPLAPPLLLSPCVIKPNTLCSVLGSSVSLCDRQQKTVRHTSGTWRCDQLPPAKPHLQITHPTMNSSMNSSIDEVLSPSVYLPFKQLSPRGHTLNTGTFKKTRHISVRKLSLPQLQSLPMTPLPVSASFIDVNTCDSFLEIASLTEKSLRPAPRREGFMSVGCERILWLFL